MLSIIGCGNTNRSDDAVGCYVVAELQKRLDIKQYLTVNLFDAGTAGMDVMFKARGSKALIIIDASNTGSDPGSIHKVPGDILENNTPPSYNLHDFRWDHAIYAGRQIFKQDFPTDITVYLIEVDNLDFGLEISDCVKASAEKVVVKIMNKIANLKLK